MRESVCFSSACGVPCLQHFFRSVFQSGDPGLTIVDYKREWNLVRKEVELDKSRRKVAVFLQKLYR